MASVAQGLPYRLIPTQQFLIERTRAAWRIYGFSRRPYVLGQESFDLVIDDSLHWRRAERRWGSAFT